MDENLKLIKFGRTDALLFATALSSNLISIALIANIPSFGATGVVLSTSIMLLISAFLELPTGFFADKYGHKKALLIGLTLKVFVTFFMLLAIGAALLNHYKYIWIFIIVESILDAFASSFMNGSYQASYLKWFGKEKKSNLFFDSYKYGFFYRILLPLVAIIIGYFSFKTSHEGSLLILAPLVYVFFLRLVVILKVALDLRAKYISKERDTHRASLVDLGYSVKNDKLQFIKHTAYSYLYYSVIMCLFGEIYKTFSVYWSSEKKWIIGLSVSFLLNLIVVLFNKFLYEKIKSEDIFQKIVRIALSTLIIATTIFFVIDGGISKIIIYSVACLITLIYSSMCMKNTQVHAYKNSDKNVFASWLSLSNAFAFLLYAMVSAVALYFNKYFLLANIFLIFNLLLSVFLFFIDKISYKSGQPISLVQLIKGYTMIAFFISILLVTGLQCLYFFSSMKKNNSNIRNTLVNNFVINIREPLLQGSFVEALNRISGFKNESGVKCVAVIAYERILSDCEPKTLGNYSEFSRVIAFEDDSNAADIKVYFDDDPYFKSVLTFSIYSSIFNAVFFYLLYLGFGVFLKIIKNDLDSSIKYFKGEATKSRSNIEELEIFLNKLKEIQDENKKLLVSKELAIVAAQVAHDIRAPVMALDSVASTLSDADVKKKELITNASTRISSIAEALLKKFKYSKSSNSQLIDEIPGQLVKNLCEEIINEKKSILKAEGQIFLIDRRENNLNKIIFSKTEFMRIISNVLNNSIDASVTHKFLEIILEIQNIKQYLVITITDNGKGISADRISSVGKEGYSFGKEQGTGLGINHAMQTLELAGGRLEITSNEGFGTSVIIKIPLSV